MTELPRDTEIELAALADGALAAERREQALSRVRQSKELQAALAEQQHVVDLTAAVDVRAPESLHHRIEAMLAPSERVRQPGSQRRHSSRRRWLSVPRLGVATMGAVALIVVLVAGGLFGGHSHPGPSGLNVQQAAALALSQAKGPAPVENEQHRSQLTVAVDGVPFPYWKERFGWRSSGTRSDRIAGRMVTTVFYTDSNDRQVGYAIASGGAPATSGGTIVRRWGVSYRLLSRDGATVVTWQRDGHLCVMAGRGVSARTLLSLASWGSEKPHAA
jgi:hypothetical protein